MFELFQRRKSIQDAGLLKGAVDNHSHILYGLDDGVKTCEDSLAILQFLEEEGMTDVWFTPHVMEDVPNTTEGIRTRFGELKAVYQGGLNLHLAAEYMIDTLFERRLAEKDLLEHGPETVLVETSAIAPPINLWETLEAMFKSGFRPLIAHPERYHYMDNNDYRRLYDMGCYFQLNLPSIVGFYGDAVRERATYLLNKGMYCMVGSDCHRYRALRSQYAARELKKDVLERLSDVMAGTGEI